jgi:hypothetical protein
MEKIYEHWKTCFFTEALLVGLLVVALWVSVKNRRKHPLLRFFPLYIISLLIVFLTMYISIAVPKIHDFIVTTFNFTNYIDYIFILFELAIFSHFFLLILSNKVAKRILIILALAFVPYFIIELFSDKYFPRSISETRQSRVYTIESIILLFPCIVYFIELFQFPPTLNLKNEPPFWIATGWIFFATCTLPYSLLENYLRISHSELMTRLYSVFYIFYFFLFTMIIRGYLCKREVK